jgi:hypothetical protein
MCLLAGLSKLEDEPEWMKLYQKAKNHFDSSGKYQKYSNFFQLQIEFHRWSRQAEIRADNLEDISRHIEKKAKELAYELQIDAALLASSLHTMRPESTDKPLAEPLIKEMKQAWRDFPPYLQMTFFGYLVEHHRQPEDYDTLVDILKDHLSDCDKDLAMNTLLICLNYNIRMTNRRINDYAKQYAALSRMGFEEGILFPNAGCTATMFMNNVILASRLGDGGWMHELKSSWLPLDISFSFLPSF